MAEHREGGSIPKFIVVAVVLITLFGGGAYFVQQIRHKPVTVPTPVTELPGGDQKPPEEPAVPPSANNEPNNNSTGQSVPQPPTRLPQSGPDSLLAMIILGLLAGAGASYVQSRRRLAPL